MKYQLQVILMNSLVDLGQEMITIGTAIYNCISYNKDSKLRSRSAGRAGRAMGNGSFERSWTPHEHTLWPFLIFALPALPGAKIALPPL